ncbi:PREDICTED: chloride channel protein ClC-Kb-like [Nanorana parkeri]|uniref:chloride channel protein ClC-Kb-like n=1 Tax=Nanorana parkeri TaxID=125878 RepID=UPI0008549A69|nr:PREDICTED: chloride channel protein ClC-Kb-like [Nanorana parkeri]
MELPERKEKRGESNAESEMTESEAYSYNPKEKENQSTLLLLWSRFKKSVGRTLRYGLKRFGEDWIFLFLLGISMASLSFGLDVVVAKLQRYNLWVYDALDQYRYLQYFSWILYHVLLMCISAGVAKYISPQAAGSGIPEIKVTLRGVVLAEFFTLRTFIAKLIGVTCTLAAGNTIFLGKVGPFVHMAAILATQLGKVMVKLVGAKENASRKYELLIAGAAVGVACCFVAPVGGVLFSVEATATHFAVRNYWRGFFAATCAALMFRLLAVLHSNGETVAILFRTGWTVEFPFDLPEYFSYAVLGVVCGCVCCVYLFLHRVTLLFINRNERVGKFFRNNKIVYAAFVALVLASITFPHGFGQYMGGTRLTMKEHIETFINNFTWGVEELSINVNASRQPPNPTYDNPWLQWTHPHLSSVEKLAIFVVMKFFMLLLANTMIIPAGYFLPVFVYGAGLGRLYGEIMAKIFPNGFISEGIPIKITPAGYALAGAAAYSGAVTHTLSTALLVFELTGQMSHILPVLIAVLIANAISQSCQNSFFDLIIIIKKLPYLPKLAMGKNCAHDVCAEDFMVTDLTYLVKGFKYKGIRNLLKSSDLQQYPIVDSEECKILLGSVSRKTLTKLLTDQLSPERRMQYMMEQNGTNMDNSMTVTSLGEYNTSRPRLTRTAETEATETTYSNQDTVTFESEETSKPRSESRRRRSSKFRNQYQKLVEEWECRQLNEVVPVEDLLIDPAPYRLVEKQTLYQVYDLFNLLSLRRAYVTSIGRLVGVISLTELKDAVHGSVKGTFTSRATPKTEESNQEGYTLQPLVHLPSEYQEEETVTAPKTSTT